MNSKLRLTVALALACVIQLSGTGKLWAQNNDCWVKIAFLGYYTDYNSFISSASYPQLCRTYPELKTVKSQEVYAPGEEFYLVIPSKGYNVTVHSCTYDMWVRHSDELGEILHMTENGFDASLSGKPFLMQCNETYPNTMLVIYGAEGIEDYYPYLDLNQGSLPYSVHVVDISHSLPQAERNESGPKGISATVKNGKVVLSFDLDKLSPRFDVRMNIPEGDRQVTREVSGTNGLCRRVFFGNRGADRTPWLCLLMDDGTARILSLLDALYDDDFVASPELPGFSDIISFEEGGAGEIEPGVFSYQSIFGIDKKGGRHEIPVFYDEGRYTYDVLRDGEKMQAVLTLKSNGRMSLALAAENDLAEDWSGSFFEVDQGKSFTSFDCNFRLGNKYSTEAAQGKSGTFRLRRENNKYILTPLSGFNLYGKEGQNIELKKKEE